MISQLKRSLSAKITAIFAIAMFLLTAAIMAVAFVEKSRAYHADVSRKLQMAMSLFADEISRNSSGRMTISPNSLQLSGEGPISITAEQVDRLSQLTGTKLTYFVWDPLKNDFRRTATSLRKPDGTRATDTLLGNDSAAFAPLRSGQVYNGELDVFERPFLSQYSPVID